MKYEKWVYAKARIKSIYEIQQKANPTNDFWHYTSIDRIQNIFKDCIKTDSKIIDRMELYASNIRFMNDKSEYEDGKNNYNKFVEELIINDSDYKSTNLNLMAEDAADAYIVSFCKHCDLLSQWKWYGKNSGISFHFNADIATYSTFKVYNGDKEIPLQAEKEQNTKPLLVHYNDKHDYFNQIIDEVLVYSSGENDKRYLDLLDVLFVPFCKDIGFSEEDESRLVFFVADKIPCPEPYKARFNYVYNKTSDGYVKPALAVSINSSSIPDPFNIAEDYTAKRTSIDKPLVDKMIVGPGANQELVFNGLIHIFDADKFRFVPDKEKPEEDDITLDEYSLPEGSADYIRCSDNKCRFAYKCTNGLLIMKSTLPFRG